MIPTPAAHHYREMVRDVNRTQVSPEEVLSDNPYLYDRASDTIKFLE